MPYIVTTKRRKSLATDTRGGFEMEVLSRRAVATLDEARGATLVVVRERREAGGSEEAWNGSYRHLQDAKALPESGGTVGPLPDGTVIEVEETNDA